MLQQEAAVRPAGSAHLRAERRAEAWALSTGSPGPLLTPLHPLSLQHTQQPKVAADASCVSSPRCRLQRGSRCDD